MSNLAFHVLARLNAAFDPTEMRRREAQHIPLSAKDERPCDRWLARRPKATEP